MPTPKIIAAKKNPSPKSTGPKPTVPKPADAKKTAGKKNTAVRDGDTVVAKKPRAKPLPQSVSATEARIPGAQRRHYVEVAAYYIAERRGFSEGDPLEDWAQAEAEIDRLLNAGLIG